MGGINYKPKKDLRTKVITVKFTESEAQVIEVKSREHGLSKSSYIRLMLRKVDHEDRKSQSREGI